VHLATWSNPYCHGEHEPWHGEHEHLDGIFSMDKISIKEDRSLVKLQLEGDICHHCEWRVFRVKIMILNTT